MGGKNKEHKNILAGLCDYSISLLTAKGFITNVAHGVHSLTEEGRKVLMEIIEKVEAINGDKK